MNQARASRLCEHVPHYPVSHKMGKVSTITEGQAKCCRVESVASVWVGYEVPAQLEPWLKGRTKPDSRKSTHTSALHTGQVTDIWQVLVATMLPEPRLPSLGLSDHSAICMVSFGCTSNESGKPGGVLCLRIKPSLSFCWHFPNWFLALGCPKRPATEHPVHSGQCPGMLVMI